MAEITRADEDDFLEKVHEATDDVSHAKLIAEIKGLITRKPNLLKARSRLGWNCFRCIKSVELAEIIYNRYPSLINERNDNGRLPIHSAAYNGRLPIVKFLVEKEPAMIHATNTYDRKTPLTIACYDSHLDIAKWILTRDPSTANHVDNYGCTALHMVGLGFRSHRAVECAKLLLQRDPAMRFAKSAYGETPVMIARRWDSNSEVTLFLEKLEKHDESIADSKSFLPTVKAMLLAMEADNQAVAPLCDSMVTKTRKTAMDAVVVVAEWTESIAVNAKSDIVKLIQS